MARFTLPRDLYHGKGAMEALKTFKGKKAVICVGGGSMKRFGFLDKAEAYLKEAGMEVMVIDGIEPDPSVDTVMAGAEKMLAFRTELQPLLRDAEFLDDQWLEEVKPKCFGTCWNVSKDEGLILASSERDEDVVFRVNTERPISGISCIDVEGNTIEINQENKNSFSFSLEEHQMVRILFSYSK